ncbi:MAG TPA: 5-oxoprolinase subunit PxpB [Chitinophagaceae bacterium]|nr:5-oxoprolinase subunit PxpB [Chitinophagaceae bacterium]
MKNVIPAYRIFPLGDAAVTIDFGNVIDETINCLVIQLFNGFKTNPLPGMIEAVPAYSSLTIYYDVFEISKTNATGTEYDFISGQINKRLQQEQSFINSESRLISIPVCYEKEFAPDMEYLTEIKKISVDDIVRIHTSKQYRVYMLGFLPGFSYLGEVNEAITISRKQQPVTVAAGSVGIAGKQTGIYPLVSPGGWQIIGRTPLKMFDAEKEEPALLKEGDKVQFISISRNDFIEIRNSPLLWRGFGGEV